MDTFFILGLLRIKAWIWLRLPFLESLFFTLSHVWQGLQHQILPSFAATCHPNTSAPVPPPPCPQSCDVTLAPGLAGETNPRPLQFSRAAMLGQSRYRTQMSPAHPEGAERILGSAEEANPLVVAALTTRRRCSGGKALSRPPAASAIPAPSRLPGPAACSQHSRRCCSGSQ